MLRISRRYLLASGAATAAVMQTSISATAYGLGHQGGGATITTITLVNTSTNAVNEGSVTQLIGCPFKKGDIAKNTWPQFQLQSGAFVPCTILNELATRWSDGSLKFVPVMLSMPVAIPGNSSLTVNILSGGLLPAKSPRSLNDFSNGIDPQVQVDGLDNLSGTWVMDLKQGIKSKTKIVSYGNGAAGAVWKVRANAQQKNKNHGQLLCDFYIASLANADGSLKGLRILGKVKLPYYDTTATMNWMSFSRFQVLANAHGTLIRDCFGSNFGPARAYTFEWSSGAVFDADSGYSTLNYGDYGYCTRLTTTGFLPGGLTTGQSYFTSSPTPTTIGFSTCGSSPSGHRISATSAGSGTQTATPYPYLAYFGALFTAGPSGMWDFVQGAGSDTADTTLRFQMNPAYWVSTGLVPPYNLSIVPNSNAPTAYWPNCSEPVTRYLETTGERDDLGIVPAWYARHFLTQASVDEQVVRVASLVGGQFSIGLESYKTNTIPCANNGSNGNGAAYAGMPAPNPKFVWNPGELTTSGFTDTTNPLVQLAGFSAQDSTHMPQFNYYPYLFTGEPWHLDMLKEHANNALYQRWDVAGVADISQTFYALGSANESGGQRILQVGTNPQRYGITIGCNAGSIRGDAWASALVAACAGIIPSKDPDCASYGQYFNDINNTTWAAANDILGALPSFAKTGGLWDVPSETGCYWAESWMLAYLGAAVALASSATESSNAKKILQAHVKWFDYVVAQFGGWHAGNYMAMVRVGDSYGAPLAQGTSNVAFCGPTFNWTPGGNFELIPFRNYTPVNGDIVMFADSNSGNSFVTPAGFNKYQPYYMVNLSGDQFDLSSTPGGPAITLTDSYSGSDQFYIVSTNPPSTGSIANIGTPESYTTEVVGMLSYAMAVGVTVQPGTMSDLTYRNQQAGLSFVTDPKWGMATTLQQANRMKRRHAR